MFFKNVFSYSMINVYAQIVRLIQDFVIRALLPPAVMGIWSFILVLQNFGITFDLGVLTAATRELPLLYGAKSYELAAEYKYTTLYLHLFAKVLVAIGIVLYLFIQSGGEFNTFTQAGIAAASLIIVACIGESFIYFYQSEQRYVELSKKLVTYWTCYAGFMLLGAYTAGVPGIVVANLLALVLQAYLLRGSLLEHRHKIRTKWNAMAAKSLLSFALPFRLVDYPMNLAESLDGLFIAKFFSLKILAIYMTAKLICNQTGQIPTWIGNVFIVRLTTLTGTGKLSRKELGAEALKNLYAQYLVILPIIISLVSIVSHFAISRFLPKYSDAVVFLPILLLSLYFQPRVTVIRNFWIIDKNFKLIGISNLIGIVTLSCGFAYLVMFNSLTLSHVAWIYLIGYAVHSSFVISYLGLELWGGSQLGKLVANLILSISLTLYSLNMVGTFTPYPNHISLLTVMGNMILALVIVSPLTILGLYNVGGFPYLKQRFELWKQN